MAKGSIPAEPVAVQSSPQMEANMATATVIALKGASGRTYEFEVHPWGTEFNQIGSVYVVLQTRSDGLIYVGQTGDLSERFDSHHKKDCFVRYGRTHVGVHPEASERSRLAIEQDLLKNYRWPCNDQK